MVFFEKLFHDNSLALRLKDEIILKLLIANNSLEQNSVIHCDSSSFFEKLWILESS